MVWYPSILSFGLVWYLSTLITIGLVWYPSILSIGLVWYLNGEGGDPLSVRIEHKLDDVITAEKRKYNYARLIHLRHFSGLPDPGYTKAAVVTTMSSRKILLLGIFALLANKFLKDIPHSCSLYSNLTCELKIEIQEKVHTKR